ncbi:MAG: hypothetical protein G8D61_14090 [gamma proteobacterium symbiont of Ctena orbiculata]|nr:hypothetical protein [Candidatus Thiodiazotropha taylori]MBT3060016.1 hypothetical protein [Candidatus Thiodiazotropha sp. (ex Lucina pensylvanica)]MBT3062312.1 hypothetical protein [Candidatus Thiodiazotropha sp. (ex Lucina pensylvanica)]PUB71762.1 MAG: hypothetical protein DBP03_20360 [gamma proteobacterium symbiont of Ctena orbiculata]PUB79128.1 MAG: hypothetical protein DBO99_05605 [gamma proteobacterium symbiont of Ctena orbiculata]
MVDIRKYRVPKIVGADEMVPRWVRFGLLLVLLGGVAWLAYQKGGSGLAQGFARLQSGMDRVELLEQERNELKRELAMVKQTAEVDREALTAIREQIKGFQDERLKMEEELAFLRGIVSTSSKKQSLRVQNFKLEPGLEAQQFVYKFSVSQVINSGSVVKGKIEITVTGLQDGETRQLKLDALSKEKLSSHKMRFRYYQNVEGMILVPQGFEPATIMIDVKPSSSKLAPVSESYNWSPLS